MQSMTYIDLHSAVKVIQPVGILNSTTAHQVQIEIDRAFRVGAKQVAIDCRNVTFMDVAGLSELVVAFKQARMLQMNLCLCSINHQVDMVLDLTGVSQLFDVFRDSNEFRQAMMSELN